MNSKSALLTRAWSGFCSRKIRTRVSSWLVKLLSVTSNRHFYLIGILKGACFLADLARELYLADAEMRLDFIRAARGGDEVKENGGRAVGSDRGPLDGGGLRQRVILVDDILNAGLYLAALRQHALPR